MPGSFSVQESTTNGLSGLSGPTVAATITVTLPEPVVTNAATTENVQSTSGLVVKPGAHDLVTDYFQVTSITGGTLYQNDGTTPIANGSFISLAQGAAGLKFTPTPNSVASGSATFQDSSSNDVSGLSGQTVTVPISVTLAKPTVTNSATSANTQTTSGLVITPGPNDTSATYFQITGITGGRLYQNDGITPIASGSFITVAQGAAGLKFTPDVFLAGGRQFHRSGVDKQLRERPERANGQGHDRCHAGRAAGNRSRYDGKHAVHVRTGHQARS